MRIKTKEWLAMTEVDRYMEIYRAYVRSQKPIFKGGETSGKKNQIN